MRLTDGAGQRLSRSFSVIKDSASGNGKIYFLIVLSSKKRGKG